jgi:hypothetical protein
MYELVNAVSEHAQSEEEIVATVIHMVNTGLVRLGGRLRGARFDLRSLPKARVAA